MPKKERVGASSLVNPGRKELAEMGHESSASNAKNAGIASATWEIGRPQCDEPLEIDLMQPGEDRGNLGVQHNLPEGHERLQLQKVFPSRCSWVYERKTLNKESMYEFEIVA